MIDPDYHKLSFNWPSFVPAVLSCWNAPMAVWVWNLPCLILLLYKTDLKINIISKVYDCKIFYPFLFYYHLLSFPCEQFMILGFIFIYLLLVSFFYKKVAVVGACLAEIFILQLHLKCFVLTVFWPGDYFEKSYLFNTIVADDLAMQGARASAAMVLI